MGIISWIIFDLIAQGLWPNLSCRVMIRAA